MKYRAYDTFTDWLFSSPRDPYSDMRLYLTASGAWQDFSPADGELSIKLSDIRDSLVPIGPGSEEAGRAEMRPRIAEGSVSLGAETDGTYEELFNVPASGLLDPDSPYVSKMIQKAVWSAQIAGRTPVDPSAPPAEILGQSIPFSSGFSEVEYDAWGAPLTPLNGETAAVIADDALIRAGRSLSVASGCLFAVQRDEDEIVPMGFVDFESVCPSTTYSAQFDPQGLLQLT